MKKKILLYSSIAIILGSGIGGFTYNQKVEAEEAKQEQIRVENREDAEKSLAALYSEDKAMLTDEDFDSKWKKAKAAIDKVAEGKDKKQLLKQLNQAEELSKLDSDVEDLIKEGVVGKNATLEQLQDLTKRVAEVKDWNESIFNNLSKQLEEADKQIAAINEATKKVKEAENTLKDKDYNAASDLVAKVKNEEKKNELTKQLKAVNEKVVAKAEAEEEAKRQEEQAVAKAAEQAQTNTQVNQNATSNNVNSSTASTSKSNNSSTGSSSNSSNANNSVSSSSTSSGSSFSSNKSTSSSNNSSSSSKSTSSSNNSSSSNKSNSSSNNNSNSGKVSNVQKTGEGVINTNGSNKTAEEGSSTYEKGTFEWGGW
ncbi:hypothetical protein [Bacillus sp. Au-Bac7]|uniref:hypothetical protein n=1 Tax=Bacillus sp. Au-Bac7 TaxID=2906458 RepID=UPI001E64EA59|nr:hypothetical protein [Bacillus sp. Au-Bac7]MCE4051694.1 hypothetical protein [Bacillus sp. Au-Bac7]